MTRNRFLPVLLITLPWIPRPAGAQETGGDQPGTELSEPRPEAEPSEEELSEEELSEEEEPVDAEPAESDSEEEDPVTPGAESGETDPGTVESVPKQPVPPESAQLEPELSEQDGEAVEEDEPKNPVRFGVAVVGGASLPVARREMAGSWEGEQGVRAGVVLRAWKDHSDLDLVLNLAYQRDQFTLESGGGSGAVMDSAQFGLNVVDLSEPLGLGPFELDVELQDLGGWYRFTVDGQALTQLGDTGTELGGQEGVWRYGYESSLGLTLDLGEASWMPALGYRYSLVMVESDLKVWRYLGHGLITGVITAVPLG
ncbi:MAG: hypothetical protein QGG40_12450, partial [Myxococcota bacterium]|nr:hypothetical protein [Myxococcota bacterium]